MSPEERRLRLWLHRAGLHNAGALLVNLVLFTSEFVTFVDFAQAGQSFYSWTFGWQALVFVVHLSTVVYGAAMEAIPSHGPEDLDGGEASAAGPPLGLFDALGIDELVGILYTLLTVDCVRRACLNAANPSCFWLAGVSYAMYLVHALGSGFFIGLVKSHFAGIGPATLGDLVAPLVAAPPLIAMSAECSHIVRDGNKHETIVTHRATEWTLLPAWRDLTEVPQCDSNVDFVHVTILLRCRALLTNEWGSFMHNHRKDEMQTYTLETQVARFDSSEAWEGLWIRGQPAGRVACAYAAATIGLGSVPHRMFIAARTARVSVVVRKEVSSSVEAVDGDEGWRAPPPTPEPLGSQGNSGWTFPRSPGTCASADDAEALPNLTFWDFVTTLSEKRPVIYQFAVNAVLLTDVIFALTSSHSRGLALACWVLIPLLAFLEFLLWRAYAKHCLRWSTGSSYSLGFLVIVLSATAILVMWYDALWVAVTWDGMGKAMAPVAVQDLSTDHLSSSWALCLSDGFIDTSANISAYKFRGKDHKSKYDYISAAPVYAHESDTWVAGSIESVWAVATIESIKRPKCRHCAGLCGFAAVRILDQMELLRLRDLITSDGHGRADPAMVVAVDPDAYLAGCAPALACASGALALLLACSCVAATSLQKTAGSNTARRWRQTEAEADDWDPLAERSALLEMALL